MHQEKEIGNGDKPSHPIKNPQHLVLTKIKVIHAVGHEYVVKHSQVGIGLPLEKGVGPVSPSDVLVCKTSKAQKNGVQLYLENIEKRYLYFRLLHTDQIFPFFHETESPFLVRCN